MSEYEHILRRGWIPSMRYSSEITRLGEKNLMHLVDEQSFSWEVCLVHCHDVIRLFSKSSDISHDTGSTLEQRGRRAFLVQKFALLVAEIDASLSGSARASFARVRQQLMIWNRARKLLQGPVYHSTIHRKDNSGHLTERTSNSAVSSNEKATDIVSHIRPKLWLQTQSLYPSSDSVIINYVSSRYTLQQVILELLDEQVIAVDVIEAQNIRPDSSRFDYVVLAAEKNVYIVDAVSLTIEDSLFFTRFLQQVMENASILKVMFNAHKFNAVLWNSYALNPISIYDIAKDRDASHSSDPGKLSDMEMRSRLVKQQFGALPILTAVDPLALGEMRQNAPVRFFSCKYSLRQSYCY